MVPEDDKQETDTVRRKDAPLVAGEFDEHRLPCSRCDGNRVTEEESECYDMPDPNLSVTAKYASQNA
jgi:hypothetical protein